MHYYINWALCNLHIFILPGLHDVNVSYAYTGDRWFTFGKNCLTALLSS